MTNQLAIEARSLISSGDFEGALDLLWGAIDSGSSSARLDLATLFDETGLHAFSQDQFLTLVDEGASESAEASVGVFRNLVWMRDYKSAVDLAAQNKHIRDLHGDFATISEKNFSTLRLASEDFTNLVSQLLLDREMNAAANESDRIFDSLQNRIVIDENLFNIACDLKFGDSAVLSSVSVDVPIGGGSVVSRRALDAVGDPLERAKNYLQSCASLIGALSTLDDLKDDRPMLEIARSKGKSIANKLVLLQEDFTLSDDESKLVSNVCWALQKSTNPIDRFAGFVLSGITND